VTQGATLGGALGVTGAATLGSNLTVTGATALSNTLGVTGAASLSNTLDVVGSTILENSLSVVGAALFSNTVQLASATVVAGASGVSIPDGVAVSIITGSPTQNFSLTLPTSPSDGQVLILRNLATAAAVYSDGSGYDASLSSGTGGMFVASTLGAANWIRVF